MFNIYQRFSNTPPQTAVSQPAKILNNPQRQTGQNRHQATQNPRPTPQNQAAPNGQQAVTLPPKQGNRQQQHQPNAQNRHRHQHHKPKSAGGLEGILTKLLPTSVYNPDTKKIFGFLTAEDLLLIALIFLFLDSDEEDSNLTVLALAFVLLSDYIDLSAFNL